MSWQYLLTRLTSSQSGFSLSPSYLSYLLLTCSLLPTIPIPGMFSPIATWLTPDLLLKSLLKCHLLVRLSLTTLFKMSPLSHTPLFFFPLLQNVFFITFIIFYHTIFYWFIVCLSQLECKLHESVGLVFVLLLLIVISSTIRTVPGSK